MVFTLLLLLITVCYSLLPVLRGASFLVGMDVHWMVLPKDHLLGAVLAVGGSGNQDIVHKPARASALWKALENFESRSHREPDELVTGGKAGTPCHVSLPLAFIAFSTKTGCLFLDSLFQFSSSCSHYQKRGPVSPCTRRLWHWAAAVKQMSRQIVPRCVTVQCSSQGG